MHGLRSINGNPAVPPYTNGPYTTDQFYAFTQGLSGVMRGKAGKIYYVDEENGNDSYDGLSPQTAFQTLDKCFGNTTGNKVARDDYSDDAEYWIFVFPGTYTPTDDLRLYGHGIHLIGLGHPGSDSGVNILDTNQTYGGILLAGANCTIANIEFISAQDLPALYMLAADNCVISNCKYKGTSGTTTTAIQLMDVRSTEIVGCQIGEAGGDYTNGIYAEGGVDYYLIDCHIHHNRISSNESGAKGILIDNTSTTYNNVIEHNKINLAGAGGSPIGIDNNSTGVSTICDNRVIVPTSQTPIESASSPTGILANATMAGTTVVDPNTVAT